MPNRNAQHEKLKVPHIGWNLTRHEESDLFKNIPTDAYFYFVHSYAMELNDCTVARTEHGKLFTSAVQWQNFYGVQFHPEKSADVGEQLLKNFIKI